MTHLLLLLNFLPVSRAQDTVDSSAEDTRTPLLWGHNVVRRERAARAPGVALALSLSGTIGSGFLAAAPTAGWLPDSVFYVGMAGLIVTPSLGHIYTQELDRAYFTSSLRLISAGLGAGGAFIDQHNPAGDLTALAPPDSAGTWMMLSSGVLFGGLALYDVIDSPYSARRVSPPEVSLSPTGGALTWEW